MKNATLSIGKIGTYPYMSILMGLLATVIFRIKPLGNILQYDREAIGHHQIWRVLTGHWVHWSFEHFLWCTVVFVALGVICEIFNRKGYIATLVATSIVIPISVWFIQPGMESYRGLSGIGSGLFVYGTALMLRVKFAEKEWQGCILPLFALLAYLGKISFEFFHGSALFVNEPELFSPVPLVHLVGGLTGLLMLPIFGIKNVTQQQ